MDYEGFISAARSLFPGITPEMEGRFKALERLYNDWNARINVISRKDIGSLYMRHVMHSLAIAGYLKAMRPEMYEGLRSGRISEGCPASVLDIGTGGGFPGIPLAIMFPNVRPVSLSVTRSERRQSWPKRSLLHWLLTMSRW